jgi:hypothetical protein
MTRQEEKTKNQDERDEARQDLRDTLTEVNAKFDSAESDLRPDRLVESHPVGASLVAGAIGFLLGSNIKSELTGPVIIAALLGFALVQRSSPESSERDDRETSADQ